MSDVCFIISFIYDYYFFFKEDWLKHVFAEALSMEKHCSAFGQVLPTASPKCKQTDLDPLQIITQTVYRLSIATSHNPFVLVVIALLTK